MSRLRADLLLLACAAIWGLAFLFQKAAMAHVQPLTFIAARGLIAALVLLPFALLEQRRLAGTPWRGTLRMSALAAVAFLAGAFFQQTGLQTASVTNAGFLTALYVVATPFVGYAMTGRVIALPVWIAVVLSVAGTTLLSLGTLPGDGLLPAGAGVLPGGAGVGGAAASHHGDILITVSALFWSLHVVLVGIAGRFGRPILFTALQFAFVGVAALGGALVFETISVDGLRAATVDIAYVGVLSTALTFTIFTLALRDASPTEVAIIVSTEMLFAAGGAWLFRGEQFTAMGAFGAAAIAVAIAIVQLTRLSAPAKF